MPFQRDITGIKYAIEIPIDDFVALLDSESYKTNSAVFAPENNTLCEKLSEVTPAMDIEYDGHFSNYVYLTLSSEDDTLETWTAIDETITDHIAWCHTL